MVANKPITNTTKAAFFFIYPPLALKYGGLKNPWFETSKKSKIRQRPLQGPNSMGRGRGVTLSSTSPAQSSAGGASAQGMG